MTLGENDKNAKQKDAVQVISSDEESGESEQEDSAMMEGSDSEDATVGKDARDEVGDTVMADAPVKEGPTKEADKARPESEEAQ